jgi:hypothetical protein
MFMRVMRAAIDLQEANAIQRLSKQRVLPLYQQLPGFRMWFLGSDAQAGRLISITLWETRSQAEGVQDAVSDIARLATELGVLFGQPEIYEVVS